MRIKLLNKQVIDKIRSSFTITSLSQVVEELVLNSNHFKLRFLTLGIDAGATKIEVGIDVGNCTIQVSDDGCGISLEDLNLLGERFGISFL